MRIREGRSESGGEFGIERRGRRSAETGVWVLFWGLCKGRRVWPGVHWRPWEVAREGTQQEPREGLGVTGGD